MCYDRDCSKKYSERNGRNSKNTAVRLESGMDAVKRLQSEKEENERLTYKEIIKNKEINAYLKKGNENLGQLGYTDHSQKHCMQVAHQGGKILKKLGYSEHEIELAQIAGYMHDIGNVINRSHHAEYGALLANELLKETDMTLEDRVTIVPRFCSYCSCKTGRRNDQRGGCMPGDFLCTGICFPENCRSAADGGGEIKQNIA